MNAEGGRVRANRVSIQLLFHLSSVIKKRERNVEMVTDITDTFLIVKFYICYDSS